MAGRLFSKLKVSRCSFVKPSPGHTRQDGSSPGHTCSSAGVRCGKGDITKQGCFDMGLFFTRSEKHHFSSHSLPTPLIDYHQVKWTLHILLPSLSSTPSLTTPWPPPRAVHRATNSVSLRPPSGRPLPCWQLSTGLGGEVKPGCNQNISV